MLISSGTGAKQISLDSGKVLLQATQTGVTIPTVTAVTNGVGLADDAITAAKFDESTAFPVKKADATTTELARLSSAASYKATGFATPTNITAGTITTVTNLTNLPAMPNDWLTAAGVKADAATKIATAVWGNATRTLSSFGTLIADIWGHATRTLSAFAFTVTGAKDTSVDAIKAKTDTIPASPAAVGSAMTLTVGERTAIANEVESQIIDDTDAEKVLKAITDKIASVNPSLDDLTLAGIASAVRTELTTELARIDAAISTRLATAGYTAPANADISTIKSKTNNLPASPAASGEYTSALAAIQADLDNPDQYKADVSGLATPTNITSASGVTLAPTQTGVTIPTVTTITNGVTLADDAITSAKLAASAGTELADAVLDEVVVGTYTLRQLIKVLAAGVAGKVTGGGTTTITFRGVDDTSNVIVATVDENGNRSAVTLTV